MTISSYKCDFCDVKLRRNCRAAHINFTKHKCSNGVYYTRLPIEMLMKSRHILGMLHCSLCFLRYIKPQLPRLTKSYSECWGCNIDLTNELVCSTTLTLYEVTESGYNRFTDLDFYSIMDVNTLQKYSTLSMPLCVACATDIVARPANLVKCLDISYDEIPFL